MQIAPWESSLVLNFSYREHFKKHSTPSWKAWKLAAWRTSCHRQSRRTTPKCSSEQRTPLYKQRLQRSTRRCFSSTILLWTTRTTWDPGQEMCEGHKNWCSPLWRILNSIWICEPTRRTSRFMQYFRSILPRLRCTSCFLIHNLTNALSPHHQRFLLPWKVK